MIVRGADRNLLRDKYFTAVSGGGGGYETGIEAVLANAGRELQLAAGGGTVGFVVDADKDVEKRWSELRKKLVDAEFDEPPPARPPKEGFVARSGTKRLTAGVWIWPDNQRPGALEDVVLGLIPTSDRVLEHARAATDAVVARKLNPKFKNVAKGTARAWLAWRRPSGVPYGAAIRTKLLSASGPETDAFVAWMLRLFGPPPGLTPSTDGPTNSALL